MKIRQIVPGRGFGCGFTTGPYAKKGVASVVVFALVEEADGDRVLPIVAHEDGKLDLPVHEYVVVSLDALRAQAPSSIAEVFAALGLTEVQNDPTPDKAN